MNFQTNNKRFNLLASGACLLLLLALALAAIAVNGHEEEQKAQKFVPPGLVYLPKCKKFHCHKWCKYGYLRDHCGCQKRCRCRHRPCRPFYCHKWCKYGYKRDMWGCRKCRCNHHKCKSKYTIHHHHHH